MPHGFEYIVRPYQQPGSLGTTVIPATPKGTRERAHLVWGGKGTMPSVKLLNPSTKVITCKEQLSEEERESDTIRITQDGKPENYVDVARARTVKLDKTEQNNDASLSTLTYTEQAMKLDPRLSSQSSNFSSSATPSASSPTADKRCGVTWKLKNE
jgi:hypothetical protein